MLPRIRRRQRTGLACLAFTVLPACGQPSPRDKVDAAVLFALDRQDERDALVPAVVERQRALFGAILGNGAGLADMLEDDFVWNPTHSAARALATRGDADYLAMLAGYRPPSLGALPTAYSVQLIRLDMAVAYAERADGGGGIVTYWMRHDDAWRASFAADVPDDLASWERRMRGARKPAAR